MINQSINSSLQQPLQTLTPQILQNNPIDQLLVPLHPAHLINYLQRPLNFPLDLAEHGRVAVRAGQALVYELRELGLFGQGGELVDVGEQLGDGVVEEGVVAEVSGVREGEVEGDVGVGGVGKG